MKKESKKSKLLQVRIAEADLEKLKQEAAVKKISVADIVRLRSLKIEV